MKPYPDMQRTSLQDQGKTAHSGMEPHEQVAGATHELTCILMRRAKPGYVCMSEIPKHVCMYVCMYVCISQTKECVS